ncbi:MAG: HAD hydrolase-like protein [Candidatus Doudnabacteria bacterium]
MKIKLVAFDWNGTILDDMLGGVIAESATRVHFGFKETSLEEIQEHFEIPIKKYWINTGLSSEFFDTHSAEIDKIFMQNYEPEEARSGLRSGSKEILDWLKGEKIDSIIFSNHIVPHIVRQTKRLGIRNYFKEILARGALGDLVHHEKTFKDELLKQYVEAGFFAPHQVLVVGDTIEEIEISKKFGYTSVAFTGGWQSTARLKSANPDFLINSLVDLRSIITRLSEQASD